MALKNAPKKEIKEEKSAKRQLYVAKRNVEKRKAEGWKEAKKAVDKHGRELGVKTHAGDLVLMEK